MATLYKRASWPQHRLLRIVEGAVKNAFDAHPNTKEYTPRFARSVAKRAVGTLSYQIDEVLAALGPSGKAKADLCKALAKSFTVTVKTAKDRSSHSGIKKNKTAEGQVSTLRRLTKHLTKDLTNLKHEGKLDVVEDRIKTLKLIDELMKLL